MSGPPPEEKRMTDGKATGRAVGRGQESHELANFSAYSSHIGDKEGTEEKNTRFHSYG